MYPDLFLRDKSGSLIIILLEKPYWDLYDNHKGLRIYKSRVYPVIVIDPDTNTCNRYNLWSKSKQLYNRILELYKIFPHRLYGKLALSLDYTGFGLSRFYMVYPVLDPSQEEIIMDIVDINFYR